MFRMVTPSTAQLVVIRGRSVSYTHLIGCGKCQRACPAQAITVRNFVARIDYDKCIGCQKCVDECPVHVIELLPHAASARAGS